MKKERRKKHQSTPAPISHSKTTNVEQGGQGKLKSSPSKESTSLHQQLPDHQEEESPEPLQQKFQLLNKLISTGRKIKASISK